MNFKETTKELIRQFPCSICLVKVGCYNYSVNGTVPWEACERFVKYIAISYYAYLRHKSIYKNLFKKRLTATMKGNFRRASMLAIPLRVGALLKSYDRFGMLRQYSIAPILKNSKYTRITSNETGKVIKLHLDVLTRQLMELNNEEGS